MNCPRDYTAFERSVVDDQVVDRCPECDGMWIQGKAIDRLLGRGELLKLRSLCSATESDLICPHDHVQLGEATVAGVKVDLCLTCNSLWLDKGELEKLKDRPQIKKESAMAGALRAEGAKSSIGALDVIAEGLLAVLLTI